MFLKFMKLSATKLLSWRPNVPTRYAKYTKPFLLCLLTALLLMVLAGCSKAVSVTPIPQLPANLASNCPLLPAPPTLLTDPDRAVWESDLIAKYTDCSVKHRLTVEAWKEALKATGQK